MEDINFGSDLSEDFLKEFEESSMGLLFSPFPTYKYINPQLELKVDVDEFLTWLSEEEGFDMKSVPYNDAVSSMCEYACLYIAMKHYDDVDDLQGKLYVVCGEMGFWGHWWIEYVIPEGKTFIIDLTLQQFIPEAPKLSIIEKTYERKGYHTYDEEGGQPIKEYCAEKDAFDFYANPHDF